MRNVSERRILLGVTGGIAAYKSAELARLLMASGAQVQVVMTESATTFVGPITFQALSGNPVYTGNLAADEANAMAHIRLARWADQILIAPATADFIAKLRLGLADDLLSSLCLAAEAPLAIAPAMNQAMWRNPATQENLACLRQRGIQIIGPADGLQACGEAGHGRMSEPGEIVSTLLGPSQPRRLLSGVSILVTAGPTREAIDPVRFISNRSSGKMGYGLATAAAAAGAEVVLVSGPTALPPPAEAAFIGVESAAEMHTAVMDEARHADIVIAAAAVADYRPAVAAEHKIKKSSAAATLDLERTPDILADLGRLKERPFLVGFAAETENLAEHAKIKLREKNLDLIAANWVGRAGVGFDSDENALCVYWRDGSTDLAQAPKSVIAQQLIALIADRYHAHRTDQTAE